MRGLDAGFECAAGEYQSSAGATACVDGEPGDSCVAGDPAADDALCDATDDDCDGTKDENYTARVTTCGHGVCARAGMTSCVNGDEQDSCAPGMAR